MHKGLERRPGSEQYALGPVERRGPDAQALLERLRGWAQELGFSQIGVSGIDLRDAEPGLSQWLQAGFHGDMDYMARHGMKRARPAELVPGTISVVSLRMDYLPRGAPPDWALRETQRLQDPGQAVVSLYARGRDYHRVLRGRLQTLAERLQREVGPLGHRVFTDSAPVLEVELACRAGVAWRGKHTLGLHREGGSLFFLGELFVDLALPPTAPTSAHCGACSACIDVCPTQAIVAPYRLDARRCIAYLTIEHQGPIPEALREAVGNRVYGCDDCQLACPWNKYAQRSPLPDFDPREGLGGASLLHLWSWDEPAWKRHTEGTAIRRIGFARWRRNLAVAMGNARRAPGLGAPISQALENALREAWDDADALVREHIDWALRGRTSAAGDACGAAASA